ncbi:beta strand repeat-containing protein [Flavobacterium sp.]|uniref:beta strand repeat-containing protein n=1 Tax=Flavobacterium sp. TaxID=239 RepID=UPI0037C0E9DC
MKIKRIVLILFCFFLSNLVSAQSGTITSVGNGNWNADATWANVNVTRTGTITCSTGSTTVTGTGTLFLTQLTVGSVIQRTNGNAIGTVASIASNTSLTLVANAGTNQTNQAYRTSAGPPSPVDTVVIDDGDDVTVNLNSVCAALTIASGGNDSTLIISGTNSLTVNGIVTINNGTGTGDNKIIEVGSGTLTCNSVVMADTTNDNRDSEITISTGTVNVLGNLTMNGSANRNAVRFSGSGLLNIGGTGTMSGGALIPSTGTVNYNGSVAQNIGAYTYNNLTTSNSGTKTLNANITVTNSLSVEGTTVLVPNAADRISNSSPIDLNGGTYRSGATTGFSDTVGVLTLSENSNIILGTGNHTLTFANSNAASWIPEKTLTITGWVGGYNGTAASGTNPKIFVGTLATHLTTQQLNQIRFFDGTNSFGAILLGTGELVPNGIPRVVSFSPMAVCPNSTITINGSGFIGVSSVRVNGVNVQNYTVNSSTSITATLTASQTSGAISVVNPNGTGTSSGTLIINPIPTTVTAVASAATICSGGSINLTSSATSNSASATTLLTQNFNGTPTGWTTTNTSTGGTPANAAWTLRPNGYVVCPTCGSSQTLNSNDASQFYLSDSDRQG